MPWCSLQMRHKDFTVNTAQLVEKQCVEKELLWLQTQWLSLDVQKLPVSARNKKAISKLKIILYLNQK
ncbi:hypothetical protein DV515_00007623 [Chloebia gouldiae]|uniref:Uncharacterized protein n=1 Tax=Chloebia gouldiae TaxID=44316 RepID=A0A3L8SHE5_CHLGU|nr:hypothetical protein DV515_00007623 [Chloebia gouldiae]